MFVQSLRVVDREVKLAPLPKLSPKVARRRIATLLAFDGVPRLETLAEIRLYQALELIEVDEVENAFDIVGGPDALMLMHGPIEERLKMARKWALDALSQEE